MRRGEMTFFLMAVLLVAGAPFADSRLQEIPPPEVKVAPGSVLSTAWYCPAPSGQSIEGVMSTTNLGPSPVELRRWGIGDGRSSEFIRANVPGHRRSPIALADLKIANAAGLSETFGSATTSDLVVLDRSGGVSSSRCSVQPWDKWYFASLSTARGQNHHLIVANPFEEEAVIRVRIIGSESDFVPARMRDLVVPELSQLSIFLSEYVPETASFGVELTVTQGRVIASNFADIRPRVGASGISLDVGVRGPASTWHFAGGEVPSDGEELLVLLNPTESEALVKVVFQTDTQQTSPPGLEEVSVPGGRQVTIKVADHLPRGTKHSTSISVTNDEKIVAERHTTVAGGGVEKVFGVSDASVRWALSVGSTAGGSDSLSIMNPDRDGALVRIALVGAEGESAPPELSSIRVAPGLRTSVDLSPFLAGGSWTAVVESSSGKIVVERHLVLGPPFNDFADSFGQAFE